MALDFPASPINGQVYGSYVYNSTVGAWQAREDSATVATISTVLPTNANPGDIWYDSDDGTSYIYYDDGTSAQWVELLSSGLPLLNTKADLAGATFTGNVTAPRFISNIATGTSPLSVTSTTVNTNLNADLLDGNHATAFALLSGASFTGNLTISSSGTLINGTNGSSTIVTSDAGKTPLTVRGAASQTADLQQWQNSGGTVLAKVEPSGNLSGQALLAYNYIQSISGSASTVPSIVRGAASQTANLQEWQDSTGSPKSVIESTGKLTTIGNNNQSTVGASNGSGGIEVRSTSTTAAVASFHVPGNAAINMGVGTDSKFSIGGWSFPANSLTIDLSGRVSAPNNPLFSGTDTRALVITNAVLNSSNCFNQIDYNVGNHFNASTGRFTAPIAGYYEMSVHIGDTSSNSAGTNIRLSKNGALNTGPLAEGYNQIGTGATNVFVKAYIYCAVGDYLEFQAAALNTLGGVQHKRFLIRFIQ